MDRLLPKHDYFKHTTRHILSEDEKQEIIDAAFRAINLLNTMIPIDKTESWSLENYREGLQTYVCRERVLSRCVSLIKGSTQPRHLYRRSRRFAIELEAGRIANETGAEYEVVRRVFMKRMNSFVSDYP